MFTSQKGHQMKNRKSPDLIYCGALKALNVEFECLRVTLEIKPENNLPDHIMKGTPLKGWWTFTLNIGEHSFKGTDLNQVVDEAYKHFDRRNPGYGEMYDENNSANS